MIHVGIVSVGLCTPLGFDRETTVREISAGSDAFEETHVLDAVGAPVRACASPLLPRSATRMQRMKALAVAALDEPLAVALHLGATRLPLALGLPEPNGAGAIEPETLLLALRERAEAFGIELAVVPGALHFEGRAATFSALRSAAAMLSVEHPFVLVGAVDSLCDTASLVHLASVRATLGAANVQGVLPGEGAGFALLAASSESPAGPTAHVCSVATGIEPIPFVVARERPTLATGLTAVLHAMRRDLGTPEPRPRRVLSCQTDASFWGTELVRAYLRNADLFPEPLRLDLACEALGDAGAAAAMIQLAVAVGPSNLPEDAADERSRFLIYGCADTGNVGACMVERPVRRALWQVPRPPEVLATWLDHHPEAPAWKSQRRTDHVEDLGSLVFQRSAALRASDEPWASVEDLEARIEAKLAALAVAREASCELARSLLLEDDEERQAGAVFVLAALGDAYDHERLAHDWVGLDDARRRDWSDALVLGLLGRGAEAFFPALGHDDASVRGATLQVLDAVGPPPGIDALAWLASHVAGTPEHDALLAWLATSPDAEVRTHVGSLAAATPNRAASVELLLRLGHPQAAPHLRHGGLSTTPMPETTVLLAMAGDRHDAPWFTALQEREALDLLELVALGIYGLASAVPVLLTALQRGGDATRHAAALALHRITGAGLREERWVADEDGEDPALDGETRELRSEDPEVWAQWWVQHGPRFEPRSRYRLGRPASRGRIVEELLDPHSDHEQRAWARRELEIRSGAPVAFHPAWPVAAQREALARLATPTVPPPGSTAPPGSGSTRPPGSTAPPGSGSTRPPGSTAPPGSGSTRPPGSTAPPGSGSTRPPGSTAPPGSGSTRPPGSTAPPSPGSTRPPGSTAPPGSGSTRPPGSTAPPGSGSTRPPGSTAPPGSGSTRPPGSTVPPGSVPPGGSSVPPGEAIQSEPGEPSAPPTTPPGPPWEPPEGSSEGSR